MVYARFDALRNGGDMFRLQKDLKHSTNFSDKYLRTVAVLATVRDCEKNDKLVKVEVKK